MAILNKQHQLISKPLVSIIIPCFNRENYLSETLESCLEQSYQNIEIIVIDDGSTDRTLAIAQKYAQKSSSIKVFHTENRGQCAARNLGLQGASGKYIKFLDSDDLLLPHAIECQVQALMHFNADLSMCCSKLFSDHELPSIKQQVLSQFTCSVTNTIVYEKFFDLFMNHGSTFNEILISKEIVSKVGGFETTIRAAEELNLILKLATNNPNAKVVFQPETLMLKRVGNDSLAHKMRSQKEVPYLLLSLQTAAEYFLAHGTEESNQLKGYIFNRLYVTSTYAYRDGLWEYARKALEVWKQAQVPPPKLEPRYHHILHRVFGFFNAENILMAVRMLFSSHVSQS